ncbi:MAG: radical SAM protein [Vicinamibacteraceae bacterium]|nr:radical SAM protein [Vicinamibacteraceae bacterium]
MQRSRFTVAVPLEGDAVFLMNTLTDAEALVSPDVVALVDRVTSGSVEADQLRAEERDALAALEAHGFLTPGTEADAARLEAHFAAFRDDSTELRVTVLTTLQCNFACDYCIQGDHGDHNAHAARMSVETAARVADWIERRLDAVSPERLVVTFFGGEPLLNLPAVYTLAERLWTATRARGVTQLLNIITNGLLLSPEVVDRLAPLGLNGVKVTLDGDRATHDRMRPLRGRQGTFDRIIRNIAAVADRCRITIGGNFDAESAASFPALLDFLAAQDFAPSIAKVSFKPVIGRQTAPAAPATPRRLTLTPVDADGRPIGGACATASGPGFAAGGRSPSPCDSCHFVDEALDGLRRDIKRRGFPTPDGLHMGPCEIHKRHAYTIGPTGDLYACPGFAGEAAMTTGHIAREAAAATAAAFERLEAWKRCGDCSFVPVCAGGCTVAAHHELGDMHAPACHKASLESALVAHALEVAAQQKGAAS